MNSKNIQRLLIVATLFALLLAGISSFSKSYSAPKAFGACSAIGSFTQPKTVSNKAGVSNPDASGRKWTVNELFGGSVGYSTFYGEGPATSLYAEKEQRGKDKPGWSDAAQKNIESARTGMCVIAGADGVPYIFILMANGLVWLTGIIITTLIGKDLMAETLTNIVGGKTGADTGLIGTFLNSLYLPLVVLAAIIMATTLIYKGIYQRKMRESVSAILWSVGAFVVGLVFMMNPQILAGAPQAATSTITSCVIGTLSGQNCLDGEVKAPAILAGPECVASISGKGNQAENVVNSLNCTIWKAFILEPWAEEQFGIPYNKLYTKKPPEGGKKWNNIPKGEDGSKYCVNLSSKKSFSDSIESGTPVMDGSGGTVCNVALYQLFLKTKVNDTVNQSGNNYKDKGVIVEDENGYSYDSRWYDIIVPMATDESHWRNYAGNGMFFSRLGTSIMSLIAIIASSTVLLTLAVFGGAYKVIGLVLMAFAPIFLLIAIEPTRGKRIFLGWLETLISSLLKYFAISVLIVVSLVLYAGLLSNTVGVASLVGTIILTLALHMYRKEIINLIGASNMGGQKLSNKLNEVSSKASKFAKNKGSALVGGGVGGLVGANLARNDRLAARNSAISDLRKKLANATTDEEKDFYQKELDREEAAKADEGTAVGTAVKGAIDGTGDAFNRAMKRGSGVAARAFQQTDRTREDLRRQDAKEQAAAAQRIADFENQSDLSQKIEEVEVPKTETEIAREVALNGLRETQRDNIDYTGKLSDEEITALDNFADKLANSASDEELALAASNPAVLNDPNKKNIVANEINSRIRANSMVGISSGMLSRNPLADRTFLSDDELALNVQMHKENYLETGAKEELDKYLDTQTEISRRSGVDFDREADAATLQEFKEKVGDNYKRDVHIPTEEQIAKLNDYTVKLPNGEFKSNSVEMPESLVDELEKNGQQVDEIKDLDEKIKVENSKRREQDNRDDDNNNSGGNGPANNTTRNDSTQDAPTPQSQQEPTRNAGPSLGRLPDLSDLEETQPSSTSEQMTRSQDSPQRETLERRGYERDPFYDSLNSSTVDNSRNENIELERRQKPEVDTRFNVEPSQDRDPYEKINEELGKIDRSEETSQEINDLQREENILKRVNDSNRRREDN